MTPTPSTHDIDMEEFEDRCQEAAVQDTKVTVDPVLGIAYGVRLLNWRSEPHKRTYTREAVAAACKKQRGGYSKAPVFLNHAPRGNNPDSPAQTKVQDRIGTIINPRTDDKGALGDIKYNVKHAFADTFAQWLVDDPGALGLSHDVKFSGPFDPVTGEHTVNDISRVFSVDVVDHPGTTYRFSEAEAQPQSDPAPQDNSTPDPVDVDISDMGAGDEGLEHLGDYAKSVVVDTSCTPAEKVAKLKKLFVLLKAEDDEGDEPTVPASTPKKPKDTMATESAVLPNEFAELRLQVAELTKQRDTVTLAHEKLVAERAQETEAKDAATHAKNAGVPEDLITDTFIKHMVLRGRESWEEVINDRKIKVSEKTVSTGAGSGDPLQDTKAAYDTFIKTARGNK